MIEYRGQAASAKHDDLYDAPISRFSSIEEVSIDTAATRRYIVEEPGATLPLDFLLIPRDHNRLLVGFHGAENRNNADLPKFQFTRSLGARQESALFISDSTLLLHEKIHIGWHIGNRDTALADLYSKIVERVAEALSVEETILIGHSAGGFSAIAVGAKVRNSRAISVNGQSVVTEYEPWTVKRLIDSVIPEAETPEGILEMYGARADLRVTLAHRVPSSSFTYFAHVDDEATMGRLPHFALLAKAFDLDPEKGGRTARGDAFVPCNWKSSNPSSHALPGTIIPFLEAVIGGVVTIDLENTVDPRWQN